MKFCKYTIYSKTIWRIFYLIYFFILIFIRLFIIHYIFFPYFLSNEIIKLRLSSFTSNKKTTKPFVVSIISWGYAFIIGIKIIIYYFIIRIKINYMKMLIIYIRNWSFEYPKWITYIDLNHLIIFLYYFLKKELNLFSNSFCFFSSSILLSFSDIFCIFLLQLFFLLLDLLLFLLLFLHINLLTYS